MAKSKPHEAQVRTHTKRCKQCGDLITSLRGRDKGRGRPSECCSPECKRAYVLEYHKLYDGSGHGKSMRENRLRPERKDVLSSKEAEEVWKRLKRKKALKG